MRSEDFKPYATLARSIKLDREELDLQVHGIGKFKSSFLTPDF